MEYPDLMDSALIDTWLCVSIAFSMIAIISSKILRLNLLEQSIVKPVILLFLLLNASLFLRNQKLSGLLSFEEWHSHIRSNISTHHVAQKSFPGRKMPIHLSHKMRFTKKSCGKTLINHGRQDRKRSAFILPQKTQATARR